MGRVHAPELEDEAWFPSLLRDALTGFLRVTAERMKLFAPARHVLEEVLDRNERRDGPRRVIDLCSGGGGPLLSLLEDLPRTDVVLTDLYPNHDAFGDATIRFGMRVLPHHEPVNAMDVPSSLQGVRTLFNALHHFRPGDAQRLLIDAAEKRQPLCAFEIVERDLPSFVTVSLAPFAALALVPFTRPKAAHLALTYGLPLIPLITAWDGLASCLRAYSLDELRSLADGVHVEGYAFRIGRSSRGTLPLRVTWLVGEPV